MKDLKMSEAILKILELGDMDRHQIIFQLRKNGKHIADSSLETALTLLRKAKTIGRYRAMSNEVRGHGGSRTLWTLDYGKDIGRLRITVEHKPIDLPDFDPVLLARMGYAPIQPRTKATFEHDEKNAKHSMAAQTNRRQFGIQSGMGMFNQV